MENSIRLRFIFAATALTLISATTISPQADWSSDKPVEQTRKNIQVLKGLRERELSPVMNYVSVAIGLQCIDCHVSQGKDANGWNIWSYESDAKPKKVTARRMMQMTMQLNQTNIADFRNQKISCYTCHRGSPNPVRLTVLPLKYSGNDPATAPPPETTEPATPPTSTEVLAKYVAAVGGREAVARVKTLVMRGTREATQQRLWPIAVMLAGADKFAVVTNVSAQRQQPAFELRQGYFGDKGWIKDSQGVRELTPAQLTSVRNARLMLAPFKIAEPFPQLTYAGVSKIGGRDAYVLVGTPAPDTTVRYFFDRETGLLVRQMTLRETVLNPIPEQVDYEDYRDVDGLKLPFTIRVSNVDTYYSSTRVFTEIKANVPVDETIFKIPSTPK